MRPRDYYVFSSNSREESLASANECISAINESGMFPIGGLEGWLVEAQELDSPEGVFEFAVDRVPEHLLDLVGYPEEGRAQFLSVYGQDIRSMTNVDFKQPPPDEE